MKPRLPLHTLGAIAVCLGLLTSPGIHAQETTLSADTPVNVKDTVERPQIEVVFVLDTTGSMSNLIEGAKKKIWSITNQIASADPRPDIKIGLVGYRDRTDAYITKVTDLTEDLDAVYDELIKFQAAGGGDHPESVNQALNEAVHKISWSDNKDTLKIIFLVGDAPAHMNYPDDVKYPETLEQAMRKDLIINTVQCGNHHQTTKQWQDIARKGEGEYVQIDQSGGMRVVTTPYDKEIAKLNGQIGSTVVVYGSLETQRTNDMKVRNAVNAPATVQADRMRFKSDAAEAEVARGDRDEAAVDDYIAAGGDLVADMDNARVKLDEIKKDHLPEALKEKSEEEIKQFLEEKAKAREGYQKELKELMTKRNDFIKKEMEKNAADNKDGFDQKVQDMIRKQGARKNINYAE